MKGKPDFSRCMFLGKALAGAAGATLMRVHMYAFNYGNPLHARDVLASIPPMKGLHSCSSCPTCQAKCKRSVRIDRRIGQVKQLFA